MLLKLFLFGGFRLQRGEIIIPRSRWPRKMSLQLLKVLALTPGHRIHREQVMLLFWPDTDDKRARANLSNVLYYLRTTLNTSEDEYVTIQDDLIILGELSEVWIDVDEFEKLANQTDYPSALEMAIDLYAGELLEEDRNVEWVVRHSDRYRQVYLETLVRLASFYRESGEANKGISTLRKVLARDNVDEVAHRELILTYAITGRYVDAIRQYHVCVEVLSEELGVPPSEETQDLFNQIVSGQVGGNRLVAPNHYGGHVEPQHNIPTVLTPLIGRHEAIEEVREQISTAGNRLVTLSGPGGVGKTRLAIAVARELLNSFTDGIRYIPLVAVRDAESLLPIIANAIGVREISEEPLLESIIRFLQFKNILLVIDNFEHLMECSNDVSEVLGKTNYVKMLITSRESLKLYGEIEYLVSPLSVPFNHGLHTEKDILKYSAAELFYTRAKSYDHKFVVVGADLELLSDICVGLDGIPLAIELAAVQTRHMTLMQIRDNLANRLDFLTTAPKDFPQKHQALRSTIDWSYELLTSNEILLFQRMSVFTGRVRINALEEICNQNGDLGPSIATQLYSLVDKNMVHQEKDDDSQNRYGLLETIREYAIEKAQTSNLFVETSKLHAEYYQRLAAKAAPNLLTRHQKEWLIELARDYGNLVVALQWTLSNGSDRVRLEFVNNLWAFWWVYDYLTEGKRWLNEALRLTQQYDGVERAWVLHGIGAITRALGEHDESIDYLRSSLDLSVKHSDTVSTANALHDLGGVARDQGDHAGAVGLYKESLRLRENAGEHRSIGDSLWVLGNVAFNQGNISEAKALYEQSLMIYRQYGSPMDVGDALRTLGDVAREEREIELAQTKYFQAIDVFVAIHDIRGISYCLEGLAGTSWAIGRSHESLILLSSAESLHDLIGVKLTATERDYYNRMLNLLRVDLEEFEFEKYRRLGLSFSLEQATAYAQEIVGTSPQI